MTAPAPEKGMLVYEFWWDWTGNINFFMQDLKTKIERVSCLV